MLVNDKVCPRLAKIPQKCVRMSMEMNPPKWEELPALPTGIDLPQGASLDQEKCKHLLKYLLG